MPFYTSRVTYNLNGAIFGRFSKSPPRKCALRSARGRNEQLVPALPASRQQDERQRFRRRETKCSGFAARALARRPDCSRRAFDRRRQSVQVIDSIYVAGAIRGPGQLSSRLFSKHVIASPADVLSFICSSSPPRIGTGIRFYE